MNKNNNKPAELVIFLQHGMDSSGTPEPQDSGSSFITDLNWKLKEELSAFFLETRFLPQLGLQDHLNVGHVFCNIHSALHL